MRGDRGPLSLELRIPKALVSLRRSSLHLPVFRHRHTDDLEVSKVKTVEDRQRSGQGRRPRVRAFAHLVGYP